MAQECDWRRTKSKTKVSSAGFAARDKRNTHLVCSGVVLESRTGMGQEQERFTGWAAPFPTHTQACPLSFVRLHSQGSHVPSLLRKGPCRDIIILECLEKPVLRPASFWHYAVLPVYVPKEKVLSEIFVLAEVVLWGRIWKPYFKYSSFLYLCLRYVDMILASSPSLKDLIPYSFVTGKERSRRQI